MCGWGCMPSKREVAAPVMHARQAWTLLLVGVWGPSWLGALGFQVAGVTALAATAAPGNLLLARAVLALVALYAEVGEYSKA